MGSTDQHATAAKPGLRGRLAELGPGWISAISALVAAIVAALGLLIATSGGGSSADPSSVAPVPRSDGQPLAPAPAPPATGLCTEQLMIAVNGTAAPLTCANGDLNTRAWEHYARTQPFVMGLGPGATPEDVGRAMCADFDRTENTIPQEQDAYRLAEAYNGWNFSLDPSELYPDNC